MNDPRVIKKMAAGMAISLEMAVTVVVGVLAGYWLDRRLGSSPLLLMTLSLGALVAGIYRLTKTLHRLEDDDPDSQAPRD